MEWSFVTAYQDGNIRTIDGLRIEGSVQNVCEAEGWEIEHSALSEYGGTTIWNLILSRPLQPMMPTRGHLDDSVIVGIASSGERMLHEAL
jgi:hypothetical protein